MEKQHFENRKFKFWFYHVTHGEAIIRSMKNSHTEKNIDIYLADIQYIEMPVMLSELSLENANKTDVTYLSKKICKEVPIDNIVVLISGEHRYYVIASVIKVMENSLELDELPVTTFMKGYKEC